MTYPILQTKFYIPSLRSDLVARPGLLHKLTEGFQQGCKLTFVSAPAGYGKTTLLAAWLHSFTSTIPDPDGVKVGKVAWLSVDTGDNNVTRFWTYFISALQTIPALQEGTFGQAALSDLESSAPSSIEIILTGLLNEIMTLPERVLLVLDDLHLVTDLRCLNTLYFLVEHLPPSSRLHLVISTRRDPPWPMARLRARREINELRMPDLRFTKEEIRSFFSKAIQFELSPHNITALETRTEGWIAGLQMAALAMQGLSAYDHEPNRKVRGIVGFIEAFTGSHRYVLDYLVEEVLDQQIPAIQQFLLNTSILGYLSAPLCHALTDIEDCQSILNQLEQANLFLVPLDEQRRWYRYHHLFADLLYARLTVNFVERLPELHARASAWFEENGFQNEAILHALKSEDIGRITRLVTANTLVLAERDELAATLDRLDYLAQDQLNSRPWLYAAYCWLKAYMGDLDDVESLILSSEKSLANLKSIEERNRFRGHLAATQAYIEWIRGNAERAEMLTQQALEILPDGDQIARCNVLITQGLAMQYRSALNNAEQAFKQAVTLSREIDNQYLRIFAPACLAFVLVQCGKLYQAFEICQQVLEENDKYGTPIEQSPVLAVVYGTESIVLRLWNDLEEALRSANKSVTLAEKWKQADTLHFALSCLGEAHLAVRDFENAQVVLEKAKEIASRVSPWFLDISERQEAELYLAKGDLESAARLMEATIEKTKKLPNAAPVNSQFILIRILQGRYNEALKMIGSVLRDFPQNGTGLQYTRALALQALALHDLGQSEAAKQALASALGQAEPQGYVQIFLEGGEPLRQMLSDYRVRLIAGNKEPQMLRYVDKLLTAYPSAGVTSGEQREMPGSQPAFPRMIETLSERELEVLKLLNSSLSVPEIAGQLFVSTSTVRTHIKNIYRKLDVHGRIEAIQRGVELGLLKSLSTYP